MTYFHFKGNQGVAEPPNLTARQGSWQNISAAAVKQRLTQDPPVLLVDVRTPEEHREAHLSGSILLPLDRLAAESPAKLPDRDAPVILYCSSGNRSATAAQRLTTLGYTQVFNLTGGITAWPYEVERE